MYLRQRSPRVFHVWVILTVSTSVRMSCDIPIFSWYVCVTKWLTIRTTYITFARYCRSQVHKTNCMGWNRSQRHDNIVKLREVLAVDITPPPLQQCNDILTWRLVKTATELILYRIQSYDTCTLLIPRKVIITYVSFSYTTTLFSTKIEVLF